MLSHLGPEAALRAADGNRQAARALIRTGIIEQAEQQARVAGCSLKCRNAILYDLPHDCTNDGSSCICYCHDEKGP